MDIAMGESRLHKQGDWLGIIHVNPECQVTFPSQPDLVHLSVLQPSYFSLCLVLFALPIVSLTTADRIIYFENGCPSSPDSMTTVAFERPSSIDEKFPLAHVCLNQHARV